MVIFLWSIYLVILVFWSLYTFGFIAERRERNLPPYGGMAPKIATLLWMAGVFVFMTGMSPGHFIYIIPVGFGYALFITTHVLTMGARRDDFGRPLDPSGNLLPLNEQLDESTLRSEGFGIFVFGVVALFGLILVLRLVFV